MSEDPKLLSALGIVLSRISLDTSYDKQALEGFILTLVPSSRVTSTVICTLARRIIHSPHTHQHLWLGEKLSHLVEKTRMTRPLTTDEMDVIHGMASHHLE
jgi:hypothetical protein